MKEKLQNSLIILILMVGICTEAGFAYNPSMYQENGQTKDSVANEKWNDGVDGDFLSDSYLEKIKGKDLKIELKDGTELMGKIVEFDSTSVSFRSISGLEIKVPRIQIEDISSMRGEIVEGQYRRYDPNWTRLFFAPTGRPIKAGEGYFAVYEIFFPFLAVGITDWMSFSGGISLLPGAPSQMYYGNIKVTPLNSEKFSFSAGALTAGVEDFNFGIVYSCATYGDNYNSITGGLGLGYSEKGFTETPALMLGAELSLSNNIKMISENWFIDEVGLFMFGLRFFGDHIAADFGLIATSESTGGWPFIPWLGFSYNWGK